MTEELHAMIELEVLGSGPDHAGSARSHAAEFLIDSGYNGGITLPLDVIERLGLTFLGILPAALGDGSEAFLASYEARVEWHAGPVGVIVLASDSEPLVGMDLLHGSVLRIHVVPGGEVAVEHAG
ncbi:MAG: hypothetical protein KF768_04060 [Phycisphaeraceae bacterium]|nr:hypothetical protein [Phycisphaeraceae bacterium]